jgi:hypothetical protein
MGMAAFLSIVVYSILSLSSQTTASKKLMVMAAFLSIVVYSILSLSLQTTATNKGNGDGGRRLLFTLSE